MRKGWFEERQLQLVPANFGVEAFAGVAQVAKLTRYRYRKRDGKTLNETVFFITNLTPAEANAQQVLNWTRKHWTIENHIHRARDVNMHEDAASIRQQHAPRLLATLSNAIIGLLARRGYPSLKQATERFQAQPSLALDLIASTI